MPPSLIGDRGQSSPVGYALVLGVVVVAVVTTVALGSAALNDAQGESSVARAEQTMTLFDSRTAQVALGESSVHTVGLGGTEGTYAVDPTAGSISIVQLDCDDGNADGNGDENDDNDDVVSNTPTNDLSVEDDAYIMEPVPLGRVTYTTGSTTLAYEGGGVWRTDRQGDARMISPPEFHYRGATLTLPIVLTRGTGGGSGAQTRARVTDAGSHTQVFPSSARNFPGRCGAELFTNPVEDGTVFVQVQSEYYRAWGEYFETRTDGEVTYPAGLDDVVRVELVSLEQVGAFEMPNEGGSVPVTGSAGDHSVEEFSITLRPDDTDSANFNNLQWSMYAEEGDQRFEVHLRKSGSGGCPSPGITADMTVYYSDDGGSTYHGWEKEDAFVTKCDDLNGDGDDEIYMEVTFVDDDDSDGDPENPAESDVSLEYVSLSKSDMLYFNPNSGSVDADVTLGGHGAAWEPSAYETGDGDTETVDRLFGHYFAEFPEEFDLTVDDKNSDTINEDGSSGRLFTGGGDRYVTFIHVTQNEVTVGFE
jgi:hypothetical protein